MSSPSIFESQEIYSKLTEKLNMLGLFFSALIYGIHVALFFTCFSPIRRRDKRLLAFISMLFTLATVGIILQLWWTQVAFIDNRDFPGGPPAFLRQEVHSPANLALTAIYLVLNWLVDGMLLYRFYVIYGGSRRYVAIICTLFSLVAVVVTGALFLPQIAALGSNLWTDISTIPGIAYMSLSISLNTIITLLIVGRILYARYQLRAIDVQFGARYTSIATLLIESAALYTVGAIISVVACGLDSPIQYAFLPALGQLQAIPPLLITSRVAKGEALTRETYSSILYSSEFRQPSPEEHNRKSPVASCSEVPGVQKAEAWRNSVVRIQIPSETKSWSDPGVPESPYTPDTIRRFTFEEEDWCGSGLPKYPSSAYSPV